MGRPKIRIGTRGSLLARWQAEHVARLLRETDPGIEPELCLIRTRGDRILDRSLAEIGGKGLFLKEIEEALLGDEIDLAVHSLKDVPGELPPGCRLAAFLPRHDPRDALCLSRAGTDTGGAAEEPSPAADRADPTVADDLDPGPASALAGLPEGARVGTGSLRRRTQLLAARPDLEVVPIRGNVDTRLRKADAGEVDAVVLARAGLERLGLERRIDAVFSIDEMVPAVAQGVICLEVRSDDVRMAETAKRLEEPSTAIAVEAERAFLRAVGGDCKVPMGAYARLVEDSLEIDAMVGDAEGEILRGRRTGAPRDAGELGADLAGELLSTGGEELLARIREEGSGA